MGEILLLFIILEPQKAYKVDFGMAGTPAFLSTHDFLPLTPVSTGRKCFPLFQEYAFFVAVPEQSAIQLEDQQTHKIVFIQSYHWQLRQLA